MKRTLPGWPIEKLVPNQGLQRLAVQMAASHPRAMDYLREAPVLVAMASNGTTTPVRFRWNYIASEFGERVVSGPKLRDLMQSYGVAVQFRALFGSLICAANYVPIRCISRLSDLNPSSLSQAIPLPPGKQMKWLRACHRWSSRMNARGKPYSFGLTWAVAALSAGGDNAVHYADSLADFYFSAQEKFDPRWTYDEATSAMERWHTRLTTEKNEKAFVEALGVGFTETIPYGSMPLNTQADGFGFSALDTGEKLFVEGVAMRHCVSSYARDVIAGQSRVYSVRDGDRRVATVEFRFGAGRYALYQLKGPCNSAVTARVRKAIEKAAAEITGARNAA